MRPKTLALITRRSVLGGLTVYPAFGALAADTPPGSPPFWKEPAPITAADQVLDVMGFEPLARAVLPPAHFGYVATGVDDDRTVAWNHEAYSHYRIRAHRFVDVSRLDTSRTIFGSRWPNPVYLSAVSSMRAYNPEGEVALARAAKARSTRMMLSSAASTGVEAVIESRGAPVWQQLYATNDWGVTTGIVRRAESAGCDAIVLTVDARGGRNRETLKRAMQADNRVCTDCHINNSHDAWRRAPMFAGLDVSRVNGLTPPDLTVEYLDRLRALVKTRLFIKGIVTGEDAATAVEHGADAIIVSNHGGREEETMRATIDSLPEVVAGARGRVPVFVDGGVRRGTDVFKALALGATAVGIGRPQAWGLAAFGQPGVEAVLNILNRELVDIMRQAGTPTIDSITGDHLVRPPGV